MSAVLNCCASSNSVAEKLKTAIRVLSYNIWFDDVHTKERMDAIASIVNAKRPDVVLLQEVTQLNFSFLLPQLNAVGYEVVCPLGVGRRYGEVILQQVPDPARKWCAVEGNDKAPRNSVKGDFATRIPFTNSEQDRWLQAVTFQSGELAPKRVVVATSHLESLKENFEERQSQLKATWEFLQKTGLPFIFGGDTNLTNEDDRAVPLPPTIEDGWVGSGSIQKELYTWDQEINTNLGGFRSYARFDRFYCSKKYLKPSEFETLGRQPVLNDVESGKDIFPSDHWGIMASFELMGLRTPVVFSSSQSSNEPHSASNSAK